MMSALSCPQNHLNKLPKRILIIEDEVMMAFMLEEMLTQLGYEVVGITAHLDEASEQIEHNSFDTAILDLNLNGQYTFGLADQLQKKNRPFLFATGYDPADLPVKYQNCLVLQKPFTMAQLKSLLLTTLEEDCMHQSAIMVSK